MDGGLGPSAPAGSRGSAPGLPSNRKAAITRAFGNAAGTYNAHAAVQAYAARKLAALIAQLRLPPAPCILEIGCGTGLLTTSLRALLPTATLLATDIAEPMLRACRARNNAPNTIFAVMDGECPSLAPASFDLICASLAVQWFDDLPAALPRLHPLLRPGAHLAIATLGPGSFPEWHAALRAEGQRPGRAYSRPETLAAAWPGHTTLHREHHRTAHASGLNFLRGLRGIGAQIPSPGHRPMPVQALRRALANFERTGAIATYDLVFAIMQR